MGECRLCVICKSQSLLHNFLKKKNIDFVIRASVETFSTDYWDFKSFRNPSPCKRITRFDIFRRQKPSEKKKRDDNVSAHIVDHGNVSCCANNWHGCLRLSRLLMRLAVRRDDSQKPAKRRWQTKILFSKSALWASRSSLEYIKSLVRPLHAKFYVL